MNYRIDDSILEVAQDAAQTASDTTAQMQPNHTAEQKHNDTIVRTHLTAHTDTPILGEEHGGDITHEDTYWVIDPIDGTRNYASNQPFYGTAIARIENNEPTHAVFYIPSLNLHFYSVTGHGAYRNTTRLHIPEPTTPTEDAYQSISGVGRDTYHHHVSAHGNKTQNLMCAVMAGGWIAANWNDIGIFGALAPWDMAVPTLLVREAGGTVEHLKTRDTHWPALMNGHALLGHPTRTTQLHDALSPTTIDTITNTTYNY